ncbi:hypothetical protein ANO11243_065880 [Dothideomycetidae sp. 11243]|nr:hypothetical protein ANO11243_065880 [fungal sp. No.11243]
MSVAQSSRCLFCRFVPSNSQPVRTATQRHFHSTPAPLARRKPAFQNIRAMREQNRRRTKERIAATENASRVFQPYTAREKQLLALKYSPQQLRALEAAEETINPRDLAKRGRMREDPMRIEYKDDFSKILPLIDFPVRAPDEDIDPGIRPLSHEETRARFTEWYEKLSRRMVEDAQIKEGVDYEEQETLEDIRTGIEAGIYPGDGLTPEQRMAKLRSWAQRREGIDDEAEFQRFAADPSNFFHSPRGLLHSQSDSLSADIPRLEDPRIITATGLSNDEMRNLNVKILVAHRVVNQTRMGKIQSQYYLAIAGDGKGMLGIGEGKSTEPAEGALKSRMMAIRNMRPIPRYEERTIYGEVEAKVGASIVKLSARPPGFGNRCQYLIFEMARAAGLRDLSARCLRSRNKMNVVKATYAALMSQRLPEDVAMARGKKMVDVRKVYYEGAVN